MTGVDGTPMPSFADVIQPNDAWDLVHFLRTLQVNAAQQRERSIESGGRKDSSLRRETGRQPLQRRPRTGRRGGGN